MKQKLHSLFLRWFLAVLPFIALGSAVAAPATGTVEMRQFNGTGWVPLQLAPLTSAGFLQMSSSGVPTFSATPSATSINVTGTAGLGFLDFPQQSSGPTAAAAAHSRFYFNATGALTWYPTAGLTDSISITTSSPVSGANTYQMPQASAFLLGSSGALTSGRIPYVTTNGVITDSANLTFTNGTTTGQAIAPIGAAATPAFTFLGDTDTGVYWVSANTLGFAAGGSRQAYIDAGGLKVDTSDGPQVKNSHSGATVATLVPNQGSNDGVGGAAGHVALINSSVTTLDVSATGVTSIVDYSTTVAGKTLLVKSGANSAAGTVVLVAGTATITSTAIDANTVIVFSEKTAGGTPGVYQPLAAVSAGSAVVTSAATDTSTYNWVALKVN